MLATQQQQAQATSQQPVAALAQATEAQVTALAQTTGTQVAALAQAAKKDRQALAEVLQRILAQTAIVSTGSPSDTLPGTKIDLLQKMTSQDDVEAFLCTFQRTVEGQVWCKDRWAEFVAPLLTGNSQKSYFDLSRKMPEILTNKKLRSCGIWGSSRQ